jgi:hypothetical protein
VGCGAGGSAAPAGGPGGDAGAGGAGGNAGAGAGGAGGDAGAGCAGAGCDQAIDGCNSHAAPSARAQRPALFPLSIRLELMTSA